MTKLNIAVDVRTWITREADPTDSWDAGDEDGTYDVTGVTMSGEGWHYESFETDEEIERGDEVWVVWADYSSGSTFGTSGGHGQILMVTKDQHLAQRVENWAHDGSKDTRYERVKDNPWNLYKAWNGYFEALNKIGNEKFIVGR